MASSYKLEYQVDKDKENVLMRGKFMVMGDWETSYMKATIEACNITNKDHVLEIGFGLGISANFIQQHKPASHTIIECDQTVIDTKLKEFQKTHDNVIILEGTWQSVIFKKEFKKKYNVIYFDDYPFSNTNSIKELRDVYCRVETFIKKALFGLK
jgi:spermidine synthase